MLCAFFVAQQRSGGPGGFGPAAGRRGYASAGGAADPAGFGAAGFAELAGPEQATERATEPEDQRVRRTAADTSDAILVSGVQESEMGEGDPLALMADYFQLNFEPYVLPGEEAA